ncbi:putative palmitoyltransferase ZDHHC14 [Trichinella zimbabwensis]|uniref:Palmitoyltransferase n=1 Tax=Trichinella zimbabwensis TaxID=268475 RepID=A0A0V1HFP1_9BILA|nr:putative palmitoyltransferase ZDHHC14 [Trichinella zimbabwensis]
MATTTRRKWRNFPGNNRFCCDGRIIMAKQISAFVLTVVLLVGSLILFFYFDGPFLYNNLSPMIPVSAAVLSCTVFSSLFRTSFSDPGIIPRATAEEALAVQRELAEMHNDDQSTDVKNVGFKEVLVNGQFVKLKFCRTCLIFRPPRASHCSICDNCVERFDHHCPWVGNCIGKRNYRYFFIFIVSLSLLCVYLFACVMVHIVLATKQKNFLEFIQESPGSVVVALICFLSIWSVLGLTGFHSYLITANQTTNEDLKDSFGSKKSDESSTGTQQHRRRLNRNPYADSRFAWDCLNILCGPQTPSWIDRRGVIQSSTEIQITVSTVGESSKSNPESSA